MELSSNWYITSCFYVFRRRCSGRPWLHYYHPACLVLETFKYWLQIGVPRMSLPLFSSMKNSLVIGMCNKEIMYF